MTAKSIQLCGIGNGLVDMQFRISDKIIDKLQVPKGEMRLVEELEQLSTISLLKNVIPNRCSGGSATNTLYSFAQFGGIGAYLTSVGSDGNGKYYYDELAHIGIRYKSNIIPDKATGTCLVLITPDGERTMLTCLAASQDFSSSHLDVELIKSSEYLYIEGYKFSESSGIASVLEAISIAKGSGTKISLSASDVFIVTAFRDRFMSVLSDVDLLFCNDNEAMAITNSADVTVAFERLKDLCPNVVVTMGANGSVAYIDNTKYEFSAVLSNVLDTTGAGDMYAGAFLYGMLNFIGEDRIDRAGKLASSASSLIVSQLGARYTGNLVNLLS